MARHDWLPVKACVLPRSTLGPLFYLIYINVLPDDLVLSVKRFAHDTSIFSTVYDAYASRNVFNHDLKKYQTGHKYNWKKQFNIDLNKLAQEVTFSGKTLKPTNSQFTSITHWAYFTKEK